LGSIKFTSSVKSLVIGIIYPPAAIPKLFLHGRDSDRYDNIVIAIAAVSAAAAISPESAVFAGIGTVIQNVGRENQGNFFDSLDNYAINYAFNFGFSEAFAEPELIDIKLAKEIGSQIALRYSFDAIERNAGPDVLNGVKGILFFTYVLPEYENGYCTKWCYRF
jgi:hypothetical protein